MTSQGTARPRGRAASPEPQSTSTPNSPRPPRTSPARTRLSGALLIALSLALAAGCYQIFATWLPYDMKRYREYHAAASCPAGSPVRAEEDCLRTVPFTVESAKTNGPKGSRYRATLHREPSWNPVLPFGDPGPLLEELRPGDRVDATLWRGDIMAIDRQGLRQETSNEPRDEFQMTAALATMTGLAAALFLLLGTAQLTRPLRHAPFTWPSYGKPLLITTLIAGFGVGLPAVWIGVAWWLVPPAITLIALCAAVLVYRRRAPRPRS